MLQPEPKQREVAEAGTDASAPCFTAPLSSAPSTSPLVMRPSRPVPGTDPAARSFSAISLAAAGIAVSLLVSAASATSGATPALAPGAGWAVGTGLTSPSPVIASLPSVSILAITSSLMQLSPSFFTICAITPAAGAGTSSTTLSVSISTRISSMATFSPGFLRHCSRVASATDSDSCGTFTSINAMSVPCCC